MVMNVTILSKANPVSSRNLRDCVLAEAQGFEPWNPLGLPVFKTGAFDRSAKLPVGERQVYRIRRYFANQAS